MVLELPIREEFWRGVGTQVIASWHGHAGKCKETVLGQSCNSWSSETVIGT